MERAACWASAFLRASVSLRLLTAPFILPSFHRSGAGQSRVAASADKDDNLLFIECDIFSDLVIWAYVLVEPPSAAGVDGAVVVWDAR